MFPAYLNELTAKTPSLQIILLCCLKSTNGTYSGLFGILGDWFIWVIVVSIAPPATVPETDDR